MSLGRAVPHYDAATSVVLASFLLAPLMVRSHDASGAVILSGFVMIKLCRLSDWRFTRLRVAFGATPLDYTMSLSFTLPSPPQGHNNDILKTILLSETPHSYHSRPTCPAFGSSGP
jgi:hypothetical protein